MHIEKRLKEGHSADHERDWQPYPVDPSLLYVMTIYTYIHTKHIYIHITTYYIRR